MRRYFLTVGDKNPIMFNDMLCEYCVVEIGPLHGGGGVVGGGFAAGLSSAACPLSSRRSRTDLKLRLGSLCRVLCVVCKRPSTSTAAPVSLLLPIRPGLTFALSTICSLLLPASYQHWRLTAAELLVLFRVLGFCLCCQIHQ